MRYLLNAIYKHVIVEKIASPFKRGKDTTFRLHTYVLWLPFPPSV